MKKIISKITVAVVFSLLISGCGGPDLSNFCGEKAVAPEHKTVSSILLMGADEHEEYYLSFRNKDGAGLITLEVSSAEYQLYKNGDTPIDCSEK